MAHSAFILLSFLGTVYAANDWSKACLGGVCYYGEYSPTMRARSLLLNGLLDLPSSSQQPASGTLKIVSWNCIEALQYA
jgi:hypothetical protein